MTKYAKIRLQAIQILEHTKEGELITEPDELAAFFDDITFLDFIQNVYNKRMANLLHRNKVMMKNNIKTRWFSSNKIKALENVYKLLANADELNRLKGEGNAEQLSGSDPLLEAINPKEIWDESC